MDIISLSDLFGESPQVRLLEALAENVGEDVTVPFLSEITSVSKATIYTYIRRLVRQGMVVPTERIGRVQYYTLNLEEPKARLIASLHSHLLSSYLEAEVAREQDEVESMTRIGQTDPEAEASRSRAPGSKLGKPC